MALVAGNDGGGFKVEPLEAGAYPATIVQVIDLGVQPQRPYKGEEKPPHQEILITYELADEFLKDEEGEDLEDKPRFLSEYFRLFGLKAENAKSTQRYLNLDPKQVHGGDFAKLLGLPVTLTVLQNEKDGKVYNNVGLAVAMREKEVRRHPKPVNDLLCFDLDEPELEVFLSLQSWIQDKIKSSIGFEGTSFADDVAQASQESKPKGEAKPAKKAAVEEGDDDDSEIPF